MMKLTHQIIIGACLTSMFLHQPQLFAKKDTKQEKLEKERYQQPPQLFQAEHSATGQYWCRYKNLSAKVFIGQEEFIDIVVLKKKKLHTKKIEKFTPWQRLFRNIQQSAYASRI